MKQTAQCGNCTFTRLYSMRMLILNKMFANYLVENYLVEKGTKHLTVYMSIPLLWWSAALPYSMDQGINIAYLVSLLQLGSQAFGLETAILRTNGTKFPHSIFCGL